MKSPTQAGHTTLDSSLALPYSMVVHRRVAAGSGSK